MTIWRKLSQFIDVMLANSSSMIVAERGSGRMTYATKKKPFAAQDLRVTLQRAGNKVVYVSITILIFEDREIRDCAGIFILKVRFGSLFRLVGILFQIFAPMLANEFL